MVKADKLTENEGGEKMTDQDAIKTIKAECYIFNPMNFDRTTMVNTALDRAVEALEAYKERKKGKWKPYFENGIMAAYKCSECNRVIEVVKCASLAEYPYCHCGARMEV